MRVTFLGTGTSTGVPVPTCDCAVCTSDDPRDRRLRPSILVAWDEMNLLIDTSTDMRQQALTHRIERIDAVLYTHSHADHILGLDDLRVYKWRQGRPVPVFGSRRTIRDLARTFWYVFDGEPSESARPEIEPRTIDSPFTIGEHTVHPVPLMHGKLPILGYRLGRMAYLTDVSEIPESSYELLGGLDVLVLNALRDRPHPTHLNLAGALERAARVGARRTYLTHICHEVHHATVSARLPDGVMLAHDGLTLDVGEEIPC